MVTEALAQHDSCNESGKSDEIDEIYAEYGHKTPKMPANENSLFKIVDIIPDFLTTEQVVLVFDTIWPKWRTYVHQQMVLNPIRFYEKDESTNGMFFEYTISILNYYGFTSEKDNA